MRTKIIFYLIAALLIVSLTACGNAYQERNRVETTGSVDGKQTITIGYLPIIHAMAIFEEKELLDAENAGIQIELIKFGSWTDLTDALHSGQIDGASVLIELAMSAAGNGIDLKAAALGHKDGNVIIVSNAINSVEELKGKTFAIPSNQSSHNILLNDMLKDSGLTCRGFNRNTACSGRNALIPC